MQFQFTTVRGAIEKPLPPLAQKLIDFLSKTKRGQLIDTAGVLNSIGVSSNHLYLLLRTTKIKDYYRKVNGRGWFGSLATIKLLDKETTTDAQH